MIVMKQIEKLGSGQIKRKMFNKKFKMNDLFSFFEIES